jgi:hypothetical protein
VTTAASALRVGEIFVMGANHTWARAWMGTERARAEGFRVRLAATVSTEARAEGFRRFLEVQEISEGDRVIRQANV